MNTFPRTTVGGVSLSRMIIGTNWFLEGGIGTGDLFSGHDISSLFPLIIHSENHRPRNFSPFCRHQPKSGWKHIKSALPTQYRMMAGFESTAEIIRKTGYQFTRRLC
ncbi:MAG: hypothetical protein WCS52_13065 [bacterium]